MAAISSTPAFLNSPTAKLPIFAAADVAWNKQQYHQIREGDYFIRPTGILAEVGATFPLAAILERAEQEFLKIAHYTGALILPHEWGIIEKPVDETILDRKPFVTHEHADLPTDTLLAAKVETIHDIAPGLLPEEFSLLSEGMWRYRSTQEPGYDSSQRLTDVDKVCQYSKGQTCSMAAAGVILHDIEPLIRLM